MSHNPSDNYDLYFSSIHALAEQATTNAEARESLLVLIEELKTNLSIEDPLYFMLMGELDFYHGCYENAFKWYSKAKPCSESQFLCYRANAYAAYVREDKKQALEYLNQALELSPFDPATLQLLQTLQNSSIIKDLPDNLIDKPLKGSSPDEDKDTPMDALEKSIHQFQTKLNQSIKGYFESAEKRPLLPNGLYILHETRHKTSSTSSQFPHAWGTESTGGYFIRWNHKGIVLNPGPHFLDYFHQQGLHIRDIDAVIVTHPQAYKDIKDIHRLNGELNKLNPHLHVIHYYLIPSVYHQLSSALKPHYRQQRHTVHPLEFFLDTNGAEKQEISPDIILNYFCSSESLSNHPPANPYSASLPPSSLSIRLDLLDKNQESIRIAYVSETPWNPLLAHDLEACDILIAGFGHTSPDDYKKISHQEDCLGYFGCYHLLKDLHPKLLICTEFDGSEGDIRLEIIKKLRRDQGMFSGTSSILPGHTGLYVDLNRLTIPCSISGQPVALQEIYSVRTGLSFHPLLYLSSNCWV